MADNITILDGTAATVTVISKDTGSGVQLPGHHLADPTTPSQKAAVTTGSALKVDGIAANMAAEYGGNLDLQALLLQQILCEVRAMRILLSAALNVDLGMTDSDNGSLSNMRNFQ